MVDPVGADDDMATSAPALASSAAPDPTPDAAPASATASPSPSPAWAQRLRRQQMLMQGATLAANSLRSSDHGGGSAHISLEDRS